MATFMVADSNRIAFDGLNGLLSAELSDNCTLVYLYGEKACGKSHLLKATYQKAQSLGKEAIILDLKEFIDFVPSALLAGIEENYEVICFDNIDAIAGNIEWESALFALYNRWNSNNKGLLIVTSSSSQMHSNFIKKEFITRLQSGVTLKINEAPIELIEKILISREKFRGGILAPKEARRIVKKCQNLSSSLEALKQIDILALEIKKPLNETVVKNFLKKIS